MPDHTGDGDWLYQISHNLLLAHEDKTYRGARIASASIPWGDAKGDEDLGGYHLVWTRDMVQSALALLVCGDFDPYPMVKAAADFLIRQGPLTQQERWEESCGYSPSTLAASISALICAADFARARGEDEAAPPAPPCR